MRFTGSIEAGTVMGLHEICEYVGAGGDDTERVQVRVRGEVVHLDVRHVHRVRHAGHLINLISRRHFEKKRMRNKHEEIEKQKPATCSVF